MPKRSVTMIRNTHRLNELGVPTKKGAQRWERSVVWVILRNPAYRGMACFGKTQQVPRQRRGSRKVCQSGGRPRSNSVAHPLPRDQWIQISVRGFPCSGAAVSSAALLGVRRTPGSSPRGHVRSLWVAAASCVPPEVMIYDWAVWPRSCRSVSQVTNGGRTTHCRTGTSPTFKPGITGMVAE